MTSQTHIAIIGLPSSGKTTFLAALWHSVREPGTATKLVFAGLSNGNYQHLNDLAKLWRCGKIQKRTQVDGAKRVAMQLKNETGQQLVATFPDLPGEDYDRMWERRELDKASQESLTAPAIVLLIHGDTIRLPAWVADRMALAKQLGMPQGEQEPVEWNASLAPTQVKLVALLQMLMSKPLDVGPRRLALLISAWDKVEAEQLSPARLLESKLPLLFQYLRNGRDPWDWRVWGLSAQGGDYEDPDKGDSFPETDKLRDLERPSDRIKLVDGETVSSDITMPLAWLVG